MSAKGSTGKRCGCRDPETGKQLRGACPKLRQRHHGEHFIEIRIDTSTGRRKLSRSGFAKAEDAADAAQNAPGTRCQTPRAHSKTVTTAVLSAPHRQFYR